MKTDPPAAPPPTLDLRVAIIRAAIGALPQPKKTQFAMRLRRALAAESWQQRDAELDAIELEVLAIRAAQAARRAP